MALQAAYKMKTAANAACKRVWVCLKTYMSACICLQCHGVWRLIRQSRNRVFWPVQSFAQYCHQRCGKTRFGLACVWTANPRHAKVSGVVTAGKHSAECADWGPPRTIHLARATTQNHQAVGIGQEFVHLGHFFGLLPHFLGIAHVSRLGKSRVRTGSD